MSEKVETIKAFTQVGLNRLDRATKDLTPDLLDWKSCSEANTIRNILAHVSQEMHIYLPRIIKGDWSYKPKGWPDDYSTNTSYTLEKIMEDIKSGQEKLLKDLDKLNDSDLEEEIEYFRGKRKRETALMGMISEIIHHEGQIAAILGVEKRMKGT
jgi:uncharacterized damage-inducible protein DinB